MGVLADWQIRNEVTIDPLAECCERPGVISYGLTSYGYDARLGRNYKIFTNARSATIDPKAFDPAAFVEHEGDYCLIPPNSYILCESLETFEIPRDVLALCVGKSTYARIGCIVNTTPLEPSWRGRVTIEISNSTPLPVKVYSGEGIMQIVFIRADGRSCETSYADKKGRYQDQTDITLPFVR